MSTSRLLDDGDVEAASPSSAPQSPVESDWHKIALLAQHKKSSRELEVRRDQRTPETGRLNETSWPAAALVAATKSVNSICRSISSLARQGAAAAPSAATTSSRMS